MHELVPLHLLEPGQTAEVGRILGRPDAVHRLEELGLRGGATVEMLQNGSPCIIRLAGQKLCFRSDDMLGVLVRLGSGELSLLAELPIGARARVSGILGGDELSVRLLEMGLTPGVEIALIGAAPLGDPLELEVRGYRLSVRRSEAARVQIERLG